MTDQNNQNPKDPSINPVQQNDDSVEHDESPKRKFTLKRRSQINLEIDVGNPNKRAYTTEDQNAFEEIMTEHYNLVLIFAQKLCRNTSFDSKDLLQATFERFYKYIREYLDREDKYPKAFLKRICSTIFYNWINEKSQQHNRTKRIEDMPLSDEQANMSEVEIVNERPKRNYFDFPAPHYIDYINDQITDPKVKRILLSIPDHYLRPFADHRFGDIKCEDIAQNLGMPLNTVIGSIKRASDEFSFRYQHPIEVPNQIYGLQLRVAQKKLVKLGAIYHLNQLIDEEIAKAKKNNPNVEKAEIDDIKAKYEDYKQLDLLSLFIFFACEENISLSNIQFILNAQESRLTLYINGNFEKIDVWSKRLIKSVHLYVKTKIKNSFY